MDRRLRGTLGPEAQRATLVHLGVLRKRASTPNVRISSSSEYEDRYVPGTTLADRYRIVSPLGKGGMGEVYPPKI